MPLKVMEMHHGKSWKSHGILFLNLSGNPGLICGCSEVVTVVDRKKAVIIYLLCNKTAG